MTQYGLTRLVIGSEGVVPINENRYKAIDEARESLLTLLFIEEKFDLIVENFLELETELLSSSARYQMHGNTRFHWFQYEKALLNRRLVNLLSVCRAYIDHVKPNGTQLLGDSNKARVFESLFSNCYEKVLGYRVMEAMRNFVQHRGFPIHVLSYTEDINEKEPRNRFRCRVSIYTKTAYLSEKGHFKPAVLAELDQLGGRVEIKSLVRDYVECLATIHEDFRNAIESKVNRWESQFTLAIKEYEAAFPEAKNQNGLVAAEIDGALRQNEINIFPEFLEHRRQLSSKNSSFGNLGKRFVSGESIPQ